ncbi:MAG: Carbon monoxide dehydrogenase small chain [Synergistetes bacterium ADurb.BinA166]|nr:MAG: Carbon monoxide dehydrogenase small chain [Synergistetes bacterium ADurb.BinA166]
MKRDVNFILNGRPVTLSVEPRTTLLRALREYGMTSVKRGCEEGECGTCTLVIDDLAQKSCMVLALEVEGKSVLTVEGLVAPNGDLHPLQQAFVEEGAIQCGFCTPGMIMTAYAFLRKNPDPTEAEVREALAGNLCRCTGYIPIFRAVMKAAKTMRELGSHPGAAR